MILTNISSSAEVLTGLGMVLMRDSFIIAFNFKDFYLHLYFTGKCLQIKSLFFEELVERKRRESKSPETLQTIPNLVDSLGFSRAAVALSPPTQITPPDFTQRNAEAEPIDPHPEKMAS